MTQLMWQKARQKITDELGDGYMNAEFWTIGKPFLFYPWNAPVMKVIITNIKSPEFEELRVIDMEAAELLPEFKEDVPIITWEEFINGNV